MKNGAPISAVMMPTSSSDGRATIRPTTSEAVSRHAPVERRERQQPAVVHARPAAGTGAGRRARRSRWARRPRWRRRTAAPSRAPRAAGERDALAEPCRQFVAERERVEAAGRQQADREAHGEERQHGADAVEARAADAADLPRLDALGDVAARQRDRGDERAKRRRRRGPGQRELERGRAAAPQGAHGVDEHRRDGGPDDRRPDDAGRREQAEDAMPVTTASEAPMLTPRTPGSASGLRVTPCMTAPARPSAAPTSTASSVRGIRLVTAAWPMVVRAPPSAATMSDQPTSREPTRPRPP